MPNAIPRWLILLLVGAGLVLVVVIGTVVFGRQSEGTRLEVLGAHFETAGMERFVAGTVRNNTDHSYLHVEVKVHLVDKDGVEGGTLATMDNLEPRGSWNFRAPIISGYPTSFKVDVSGF